MQVRVNTLPGLLPSPPAAAALANPFTRLAFPPHGSIPLTVELVEVISSRFYVCNKQLRCLTMDLAHGLPTSAVCISTQQWFRSTAMARLLRPSSSVTGSKSACPCRLQQTAAAVWNLSTSKSLIGEPEIGNSGNWINWKLDNARCNEKMIIK